MAEIILKAETGRTLGSRPSKRIRAEGRIPGVVYGLGSAPVPLVVEWKPLREALTGEAGLNALFQLEVDGKRDLSIVKELQRHPVTGHVIHLDFLRIDADAEISVDVPIILEGEAEAVHREDGTVDHLLYTLTINAKPADIPNDIVVDISEMVLWDTIRISDLKLPSGVTTDSDPEEAVVTAAITASTMEAEAEEAAAEEAAVLEELADAGFTAEDGEGGDEAGSDGGDED